MICSASSRFSSWRRLFWTTWNGTLLFPPPTTSSWDSQSGDKKVNIELLWFFFSSLSGVSSNYLVLKLSLCHVDAVGAYDSLLRRARADGLPHGDSMSFNGHYFHSVRYLLRIEEESSMDRHSEHHTGLHEQQFMCVFCTHLWSSELNYLFSMKSLSIMKCVS